MEEQYIQQRREKLDRLRRLGVEVYARRFDYTHSIKEIVDELQDTTTEELEGIHRRERVGGRIIAVRGHGKAGFLNLKQESDQMQAYIRKDILGDQFAVYECLDLGDFIGVEGEVFRTRTGELTIKVERLSFLSKALRPLPEKRH